VATTGVILDIKIGTISVIDKETCAVPNLVGLACSDYAIDRDCLKHYKDNITNWQEEIE